jgi:antiviral helicase SLH1
MLLSSLLAFALPDQNAGRIIRALLEIAISRRWAGSAAVLMSMSKAVEKKMWPFDHPLIQFNLSRDVLYNLTRFADDVPVPDLVASNADDLGTLIHLNKMHGQALLNAARQFPEVGIRYELRPLASDLLEVGIDLERKWEWNEKMHGSSEPFWVWIEDADGINILQWVSVLLRPSTAALHLDFIIPVRANRPPFVSIKSCSDRWMGAENAIQVSFEHLVMPKPSDSHTPLLDLPFLSLASLQDDRLQASYRSEIGPSFNAIQTQAFWSAYHSQANLLVCAPGSAGKSIVGELAIWSVLYTRVVFFPARSPPWRTSSSFHRLILLS